MRHFFLTLILLLILSLQAAQAAEDPASYYVPPPQFNAAMQVMDQGFANLFALFQNATGSFRFDDSSKSLSHLRVAIDTTSLTTNNGSQRDLGALLATMQYPEMRLTAPDSVSFTDNKAEIKANLTLHGVSKPITLQATLNHAGKSSWSDEGEALGLSSRGEFKRADFGMADDPENPTRFGDTITLMLEMQGLKQQ